MIGPFAKALSRVQTVISQGESSFERMFFFYLRNMRDYLAGLNGPQREAVLHTEGPLMIVAGAGSGKTKVLTTRIAHLMANGVDAFHILALTFTNKAAKEMKERIEHILGNSEARNLYTDLISDSIMLSLPSS